MFYLMMHSTHVIYVEYMVKDYSDSKRKSLLPPVHGLLFSVSSKGSVAIVVLLYCVYYILFNALSSKPFLFCHIRNEGNVLFNNALNTCYLCRAVILNLIGGTEPYKLHQCIHRTLHNWKKLNMISLKHRYIFY